VSDTAFYLLVGAAAISLVVIVVLADWFWL
jgi:hypothetical protein